MNVAFDVRTHFFRDSQPSTQRDVKVGERVYVDTMLNGTKIFAKSIWIGSDAAAGSGRGQILSYDPQSRVLTLHDELSAQPVSLMWDQTRWYAKEAKLARSRI